MLTFAILLPFAGAALLASAPLSAGQSRLAAILVAALSLGALCVVWAGFIPGAGFQAVQEAPWIPPLGVAWRVGVDGISLPLALMSGLLFVAAIAWPMEREVNARAYYAWFLFLEGASLGLFLTLDLLIFYVFFDLSLVGMYFLIGRWGHGDAPRAALKFFLYTLAGSLLILLALIALVLSVDPLSFDMRDMIALQPVAGMDLRAGLILLGFVLGFAIKTPLFPLHTWLPPAHVDAPGPASAILAGVLLKMGTYGLVRIPMQMLRETFATYALALGVVALASILWGSIVAFAQDNIKRRIAYTSVNHMGYAVLGIAVAGSAVTGQEAARDLALNGAVIEMVAHGLITGALFLIAGSIWARTGTYEIDSYGGLAGRAPRLMGAMGLASFASLGLPGLAGFVAEVQIFVGAFAVWPWLAAIALLGLIVTAALFLGMLQRVFLGERPPALDGFADLTRTEFGVLAVLLGLVVLIGVWPAWLIDMIALGGG
ncbi:NADH-quinone oxidoreductase subunit M [Palleronia sediminis]|uniref:NADH-quinone oxidoreductase subunit M n=1 Tax=Palleronia sediminis TaxID=2547833 RepID=A0A4R6A7E1_9RHOB|nr:NADH-quinone oxidoreductase subunit M [Palleronia sediminis]TDL78098.1 NADH-quinone oxidoreductase subunit M [Palleronia sediminis]